MLREGCTTEARCWDEKAYTLHERPGHCAAPAGNSTQIFSLWVKVTPQKRLLITKASKHSK